MDIVLLVLSFVELAIIAATACVIKRLTRELDAHAWDAAEWARRCKDAEEESRRWQERRDDEEEKRRAAEQKAIDLEKQLKLVKDVLYPPRLEAKTGKIVINEKPYIYQLNEQTETPYAKWWRNYIDSGGSGSTYA